MTVKTKTRRGILKEAGHRNVLREGTGQRREVTLIQAGWGSSGYYSEEMLHRDGARIFPVGTHMYIDHPTESEDRERPERSVLDLAATIVETPRMAGIDLVAVCEIKEHWVPVIDAIAEDIGLSIRAIGISEWGSAGGRDGDIITALTEGISVDFVTKAGAGGKVGMLIESARERETDLQEPRNAANWIESRIHRDFTWLIDNLFGDGYLTRDERIALSAAIGEALTAFNASVRENIPQLLRRDPFSEPIEDDGEELEENDGPERRPTKEAQVGDESKLAALEESVSRLTSRVEESEQKVKKAEERADEAEKRADRAEDKLRLGEAGRIVAAAVSEFEGLPQKAKTRAIESVLRKELPMDGESIDESVLKERASAAAKEELDYLKGATGGSVRTLGESSGASGLSGLPGGDAPLDKESREALEESFGRLGMSEAAAKVAAEGR